MKILWTTEVGSYMWGMQDETSDHDYVTIFQDSTYSLLSGQRIAATYPQKQSETVDHSYMEIGHLVNLLLKGNVNAIWSVLSPIVIEIEDKEAYEELKSLVEDYKSRATYASVTGMALSNIKNSVKRKDVRPPAKSLSIALRTITWGIKWLDDEVDFAAVEKNPTQDYVEKQLQSLAYAESDSILPMFPYAWPFRDYMYEIRMKELKENDI